jgi:hypothetical protein
MRCRWVVFYMEAHRKARHPSITEHTMAKIDEALVKFHTLYQEVSNTVKGQDCSVPGGDTGTIKYHKLSHITECIRYLGAPRK